MALMAICFMVIIFILIFLLKKQIDYTKTLEKTIEGLKSTENSYASDYELKNLIEEFNKVSQNDEVVNENVTERNENVVRQNKNLVKQNENDENIIFCEEKKDYNINNVINEEEGIQENDFDSETKNTAILITGATLVVVAAITFLISTWYVLPNIIKSIILILFEGVFIGTSKIAKDKLNLPKVSKAFYYIVMAYIPILIFSFSAFDLIGNFFGKNGEGINIYYAFSGFIISVIYMVSGSKRKDSILIDSSIITQMITIVLTTRIFTIEYTPAISVLLIYIIITKILAKAKIIDESNKSFSLICDICLPVLGVIAILNICIDGILPIELLNIVLLEINYIIKYKENRDIIYYIIVMIGIYIISIALTNLEILQIGQATKHLIMTIVTIGMFMIGFFEDDEKKMSIFTINVISFFILYITSLIFKNLYIKSYMLLLAMTVISIIGYLIDNMEMKGIWRNIIPFGIILTTSNIVISFNLDYTIIVGISLIILSISDIKVIKDEELKRKFELLGNIFTIVSTIIAMLVNIDTYMSCIIIHIFAIIVYLKKYLCNKEKRYYKIGIYILSNIILYSICQILDIGEIRKYIIPSTSLAIMLIECLTKEDKKTYSMIYLMISCEISYSILTYYICLINFIFMVLIAIGLYEYIKINKINDMLNLVWIISIIPALFFYENIFIETYINIAIAICVIILLTILSIKNENKELYIIASGIYLIIGMIAFEFNIYLSIICVIIWATTECLANKKYKDIFKLVIYISILILYNKLIEDLELNKITILKFLGYIVILNMINRDIVKKYMDDTYKILEYTLNAAIDYIAMATYIGQIDAMIYIIILLVMVMISYIYRLGPMFVTSIAAVLINILFMTREFWFMIPWWGYTLAVGITLIAFAASNESKDNREKMIKEKMNQLKDYMDL